MGCAFVGCENKKEMINKMNKFFIKKLNLFIHDNSLTQKKQVSLL